jgi:glyceraldehyde 3-phosphate dehydrogenase
MKTRVAINGFGRIGRLSFRIAFERNDIEIVAINDLTDTRTLAHLLKYDTNYGEYHQEVSHNETALIVNGQEIPVYAEKDPAQLPWQQHDVHVVIESTGRFTTQEAASAHITAGAKKVVLSAPAKGGDVATIVIGANEDSLKEAGDVVSNASCTTNSVAAVMDIMQHNFGVDKAMLTTIHSYTASQNLQDGPHKDLREARAAAQNIVPTTTGAAVATALTVPSLKNKFDGLSVRVPTSVVSLSDVTMVLAKNTTKEEINEVFRKAAQEPYYQGVLAVTEEPLVSHDFIGNSHSGIVDLLLTNVVANNLAKVVVWYDNEWGYSNRLVEQVADVGKLLHS